MAAKASKTRPLVLATLAMGVGGIVPDASGASVTYTYDPSGRVATALYDNGICIVYIYDAAGNRTSQTNATPPTPAWGAGNWGCFVWTP